jgi:hypothetical protein
MSRAANALYLTDGEIAARVFGRAPNALEQWKIMAAAFERKGLPRPERLAGDRRYWPAVKAFLDRRAGLTPTLVPEADEQSAEALETWR